MTFDWTINFGNVLAAGVLIITFVAAHVQNVKNITEIKTKVDMLYEWWKNGRSD